MSLLNVGSRALMANQIALQTTGHNIANVNTAGYSRQSVAFQTSPGQNMGSGYIGNGVDVNTILRNFNDLLNRQAATASAVSANDQQRSTAPSAGLRRPIWVVSSEPIEPTSVRKSPMNTSPSSWIEMKIGFGVKNLTVKGESDSEDMYSSIDIALELEKIALYLDAGRDRQRQVTAADIAALGAATHEEDVSEVINVALGGKVRDRVRVYNGAIRPPMSGWGPDDYAANVKLGEMKIQVPPKPRGEVFIDTLRRPALATEHRFLERPRGKGPAMQRRATQPERLVDALVWAGTEAIQRNREAFDAKLGHGVS